MIKTGGHGYLEWLAEKTAKGIKVYWICSTRAWARSREASLCDKIPVGVSYVTVDDFITERWELEGDGRRIVSRNLRELIALKLLSCINEKDSAHPLPERPEFVRGVASFLESTSGRGTGMELKCWKSMKGLPAKRICSSCAKCILLRYRKAV